MDLCLIDRLEPSQLDKKFSVRSSYCVEFSFPPDDLLRVEQMSDKLLHVSLILRTMVLPWKPGQETEQEFHRAWKMDQVVPRPLRKNEDPCLDPNYLYKKLKTRRSDCACDPTAGDLEQGGSLGLASPLVLQSGLLQAQQETLLKR